MTDWNSSLFTPSSCRHVYLIKRIMWVTEWWILQKIISKLILVINVKTFLKYITNSHTRKYIPNSKSQLFYHFTVKHSLKYFSTETSGAQSIPEFVAVALLDEVQIGSCNSNRRGPDLKTEWIKKLFKDYPRRLEWYTFQCLDSHHSFKGRIDSLRQRFNQSEGMDLF